MEDQGKKTHLTRHQRNILATAIDNAEDNVLATRREITEEVHQLVVISRQQQERLEIRVDNLTRKINDATTDTLDQISSIRKTLQSWGLTDDDDDVEGLRQKLLTLGFRTSEIERAALNETVDLTEDSNDTTCAQASASFSSTGSVGSEKMDKETNNKIKITVRARGQLDTPEDRN